MIKQLFDRFKRNGSQSPDSESYLMSTYNRLPVSFTQGEGLRLWDQNSREYLDALGGIAVTILGHRHPEFISAARKAADSVLHVSNLYEVPAQEKLGKKLCDFVIFVSLVLFFSVISYLLLFKKNNHLI